LHPINVSPVVFAHTQADHALAQELAAFLELGCHVSCDVNAGLLRSHEHPLDLVEQCPEHLILLLSKESWPERLPRDRWDPILLSRPLACVLVNSCPYPPLLERRTFFDIQKMHAGRALKRWLWQLQQDPDRGAHYEWSPDLEELYACLADRQGTCVAASGGQARRFAVQAAGEFEKVCWVPCFERTLAEAMGDLGDQLGVVLDGQESQNRRCVHELLSVRRCLIVLDAPSAEIRSALSVFGRSSALITAEPVEIRQTPTTFDYARRLIRQQRFAEAYDLLYRLMNEAGEPGFCAQELAWICDHWGRTVEADGLRRMDRAIPLEQLSLFE
jgi:hypothetical protein